MLYDYYFRHHYTFADVSNITQFLKGDIDYSLQDNPALDPIKTASTNIVPWIKAKNYISELDDFVHYVNQTVFGFNLYQLNDFDTVNLNEYSADNNGEYGWHNDFPITNPNDNKLTVIVNLSTDIYEGGEFEMFTEGARRIFEIDTPGTVLIFPSWIPHRVKPVTKGIRRTLSMWRCGPKFV
jgi:PKHD-type hydroxylase